MTGVLNEMRQTNRLITKEAVFHYCEQKTRSVSTITLLSVYLNIVFGLSVDFHDHCVCLQLTCAGFIFLQGRGLI